jgi:hypothetical protein
MPAEASTAPAVSAGVAGAPHQRPGDRSEHDGVCDTAARHRPQQVARDGDGASRSGAIARAADRGHRPIHEEAAGAAVFEDGAIDGEQDDVGRGDVERYAEDPLERHVQRADETADRIAAMRDQIQADAIEQRTVVPVGEKQERGDGEHPS